MWTVQQHPQLPSSSSLKLERRLSSGSLENPAGVQPAMAVEVGNTLHLHPHLAGVAPVAGFVDDDNHPADMLPQHSTPSLEPCRQADACFLGSLSSIPGRLQQLSAHETTIHKPQSVMTPSPPGFEIGTGAFLAAGVDVCAGAGGDAGLAVSCPAGLPPTIPGASAGSDPCHPISKVTAAFADVAYGTNAGEGGGGCGCSGGGDGLVERPTISMASSTGSNSACDSECTAISGEPRLQRPPPPSLWPLPAAKAAVAAMAQLHTPPHPWPLLVAPWHQRRQPFPGWRASSSSGTVRRPSYYGVPYDRRSMSQYGITVPACVCWECSSAAACGGSGAASSARYSHGALSSEGTHRSYPAAAASAGATTSAMTGPAVGSADAGPMSMAQHMAVPMPTPVYGGMAPYRLYSNRYSPYGRPRTPLLPAAAATPFPLPSPSTAGGVVGLGRWTRLGKYPPPLSPLPRVPLGPAPRYVGFCGLRMLSPPPVSPSPPSIFPELMAEAEGQPCEMHCGHGVGSNGLTFAAGRLAETTTVVDCPTYECDSTDADGRISPMDAGVRARNGCGWGGCAFHCSGTTHGSDSVGLNRSCCCSPKDTPPTYHEPRVKHGGDGGIMTYGPDGGFEAALVQRAAAATTCVTLRGSPGMPASPAISTVPRAATGTPWPQSWQQLQHQHRFPTRGSFMNVAGVTTGPFRNTEAAFRLGLYSRSQPMYSLSVATTGAPLPVLASQLPLPGLPATTTVPVPTLPPMVLRCLSALPTRGPLRTVAANMSYNGECLYECGLEHDDNPNSTSTEMVGAEADNADATAADAGAVAAEHYDCDTGVAIHADRCLQHTKTAPISGFLPAQFARHRPTSLWPRYHPIWHSYVNGQVRQPSPQYGYAHPPPAYPWTVMPESHALEQ